MSMNEYRGELTSSKVTRELLNLLVSTMAETGIPETRLKGENSHWRLDCI